MDVPKRSHALVIGGGIAGLCTARALSARFDQVTLIERDRLPEGPEHRAGVPQSHHVHALLLRGLLELERLFPGIEAELTAAGASRMDLGYEVAHCTEWGWARRARTGVAPLTLSRLLLESAVRRRVREDVSNLRWLEDTRVTGLLAERASGRVHVTGVTTSRGDARELRADLIVDASGRNSRCLDWLESHGVKRPDEDLVDSFSGYASRFYTLAPNPERWWRGMIIDTHAPSQRRWALLMPVENDRWVLTLGGVNHEYPPTEEGGFREHLNKVLSPVLGHEIDRATPLSGIHSSRPLFNRARRFDRWREEVAGFVALGDCAVTFNPYHGQGMSMATAAANTLADVCAQVPATDPYGLTRRFHTAQWAELKMAWDIATGIDMEWPGTQGKRPLGYDLTFGLTVAIVRASHEFPELKRLMGPVYQLVASPLSLLTPALMSRVAYAELRRRLGGRGMLAPGDDVSQVAPWTLREDARASRLDPVA